MAEQLVTSPMPGAPDRMLPRRVLAIMETRHISGPAKNLIAFAARAREAGTGLPPLDFTIATYLRGDADRQRDRFIVAAESAGLPVHVLREQHRLDPAVLRTIRGLFDTVCPDVIQTHNSKSHFLVRLLGLHRHRPWLAFHHGYTTTDHKMEVIHALDRWSLRGAARVVTVCGPFRDQLIDRGLDADRIAIHHNAVAPFVHPGEAAIADRRSALQLPKNRPLLLTIGRLSREKGHADLLRALAQLESAARPHLVIAGEGPERGTLSGMIERLALQGDVTMAGHHDDVRPLLAMAALFVLPSHSEGSPNALLEAMAAHLPIVATRVGGIPELARDGSSARLVPPQDPAALADAITELLAHPSIASRLAAEAKRASTQWSYAAYQARLTQEYLRLVPGSG